MNDEKIRELTRKVVFLRYDVGLRYLSSRWLIKSIITLKNLAFTKNRDLVIAWVGRLLGAIKLWSYSVGVESQIEDLQYKFIEERLNDLDAQKVTDEDFSLLSVD